MPVLASIHLGKCAGNAFANLLIREVSPQMPVLVFYGQGHPATGLWQNRIREPINAEGSSLKEICGPLLERTGGTFLVHGHIKAREYLEFLPQNCQFFTWLRHPLQRICSHYYYWKNQGLKPPQRPEGRPLFESVVRGDCSLVEFGRHPLIAEYYTAMLDPLGLDGLALAGVTEHSQPSLVRLSALLGVELPSGMRMVNQTRSKPAKVYDLTPDEELQLLAWNSKDMHLYNRALARLTDHSQRSAVC